MKLQSISPTHVNTNEIFSLFWSIAKTESVGAKITAKPSFEALEFVGFIKRIIKNKTDLTEKHNAVYWSYDRIQRDWEMVSWPRILVEVYANEPEIFKLVYSSRLFGLEKHFKFID